MIDIHVWLIDNCQQKGIRWPVLHELIADSGFNSRSSILLLFYADQLFALTDRSLKFNVFFLKRHMVFPLI